jgi:hypothetical protein
MTRIIEKRPKIHAIGVPKEERESESGESVLIFKF